MKKIITYLIINCFILVLFSCAKPEEKLIYTKIDPLPTTSDVSIVVSSDLHFLSNKTVSADSYMKRPQYDGDGRIIVYNEELIDAFIAEMLLIKPDCVVITGDLTFNGAYINHLELSLKLDTLVKAGIRVLVVPGNHDLNRNDSVNYLTIGYEPIQTTTSKDFYKIYYNCGYGNAISKDEDSLSYVYQISEDLLILMLDSCLYTDGQNHLTRTSGEIKTSTMQFVENVLENAKKNDVEVIVASHHNLFQHSELFTSGYQLNNHHEIMTILEKNAVKLYLSGHMHIQHIENNDNITEILTSSLAITPHQYGKINYQPNKSFSYQTKVVNVDDYYQQLESSNSDLLNFAEYSANFFEKSSYDKTYNGIMFEDSNLYEYAAAAATIQAILNPSYFAGTTYLVVDKVRDNPDYGIFFSKKNMFNYRYIKSIIESGNRNHTQVTIDLVNKYF